MLYILYTICYVYTILYTCHGRLGPLKQRLVGYYAGGACVDQVCAVRGHRSVHGEVGGQGLPYYIVYVVCSI